MEKSRSAEGLPIIDQRPGGKLERLRDQHAHRCQAPAEKRRRGCNEVCNEIHVTVYLCSICGLWFFVCLLIGVCAGAAGAEFAAVWRAAGEWNPSTGLPTALSDVRIEQKLDQQLPLDLVFRDESGQQVKLGQYFGKKPVVLAFVYYDCPMLCTQVLNGMVTSFRVLPFQVGNEFDVVTVSFDPRETSALAAAKKKVYVDYLPEKMRAGANSGWHFLTGDQANIDKLTEAVGFHYRYDEADETVCARQRDHVDHATGKTFTLLLRHRVSRHATCAWD